jgi:cyclic pyranopterin phosphate synthase
MPLDGDQHWTDQAVVSEADILAQLQPHYDIHVLQQQHEPARQYCLDDQYTIGIISTITHSFCGDCDRIRLTAQGELYNCLFAQQGLNIKPYLQRAIKEKMFQQLDQQIKPYIWHKAKGYHAIQNQQVRKISMHMLGG